MINGDREPLYVFYGEISVLHLSDKLYLLALHTIQAPGIGFRIFYTSIKDGDFEDENQNRSLLHLVNNVNLDHKALTFGCRCFGNS